MEKSRKPRQCSFRIPNVHVVREDSFDIRNKILDITPEGRKKLGINKSTLWYQRKKLAQRGKIKLYRKTKQ